MKVDVKDLLLGGSLLLIGIFFGGTIGFISGAWAGTINGYEDGIEAGINYSNCITEETPIFSEVTDEIIDYCWELYVYESY